MAAVPYIQKAGFLNKTAKIPAIWKNAAKVCYTEQKGRRCGHGNEADDW